MAGELIAIMDLMTGEDGSLEWQPKKVFFHNLDINRTRKGARKVQARRHAERIESAYPGLHLLLEEGAGVRVLFCCVDN